MALLVLSVSCKTTSKQSANSSPSKEETKPNIILIMADDLGWGDVGFNGNKDIKTPNLNNMAQEGLQFNRFYASSPVCSPTRGSCLTGRHPYRYGIYYAMDGHIKTEEVLLPEVLKQQGYTTGHFGKWHLGTLTKGEQNRWGGWKKDHIGNYAPPWENGYDASFVTESKVPTWNPMLVPEGWRSGKPGDQFGNDYWIGPDKKATENLEGDDSRVIMDRVIPFIEGAVVEHKPFFSVIWFHTPHEPVAAGPEYRAMYSDFDENKQHYYGCITAMDDQIGRLRKRLTELNVDKNTMIWFCSDNGPAGLISERKNNRRQGSAGPYRGKKTQLLEGGVRVPAILVWPEVVKQHRVVNMPCVTSDYFPTIMDVMGIHKNEYENPVDGISLISMVEGKQEKRNMPIGFRSKKQLAWNTEEYKLYSNDNGKTFHLYHLPTDIHEDKDLAQEMPKKVVQLKKDLYQWVESCEASDQGKDYQ
ncbi:sulfatase-like hydrolase/transferase [Prolixibacteraceae bacterium]|nr:sulfatase-like hydrolase/transferase [Prolixibacteraceae bacterium]